MFKKLDLFLIYIYYIRYKIKKREKQNEKTITRSSNRSIKGYLEKNLVEVHNIRKRHDELVIEMKRRGYNHKSDLPEYNNTVSGKVNKVFNTQDLKSRCSECFSG